MVAAPAITDRDRQALDAIVRGEPDLGIDPADFPEWASRPEIQPVVHAAYWLEERRRRMLAHHAIERAMDYLSAALDAKADLTVPAQRAEVRRAASALADLAITILHGPPRRRATGHAPTSPPFPSPPPRVAGADHPDRATGHAPTTGSAPSGDPCSPRGGGGAVIERRSLSMTEGAPSPTPSTAPRTRPTPTTNAPPHTQNGHATNGHASTTCSNGAKTPAPPGPAGSPRSGVPVHAPSRPSPPGATSTLSPVFPALSVNSALKPARRSTASLAALAGTADTS